MKKLAITLITGGMLLSGVATASALTIGGDGISGYFADFGSPTPQATPWSANLVLNKFDSSLGTLLRIDLFFSGDETSTATVTASSAFAATWRSVSVETEIQLFDPSSTTTALMLVTPEVEHENGTTPAGTTFNVQGSGTDSAFKSLISSDGSFSWFIGSGTITLGTRAESFGSTSTLSNGTFTPTGTASEHLYVVYTYEQQTPVPEPATMLLFGAGLAGLAGISRRRRA